MNLYLDEQNGGVTTLAQSYNREPIEIEGDPGVLCTDALGSHEELGFCERFMETWLQEWHASPK